MRGKDKKLIFLLFLVVTSLFFCLNALFLYYFHLPFSAVAITGKGITGNISIFIVDDVNRVDILSPTNTTYPFGIGVPYNITLNVTSTFVADSWWYSLYDLRHSSWVRQNVSFSPNSSFLAVRWQNRLTVYANNSNGTIYSDSVDFNVSVPNSAPLLGAISNPILVCERFALDYRFNATDADEDDLTSRGSIFPADPFYLLGMGMSGYNTSLFQVISLGNLSKSRVGNHIQNISVNDGEYSDSYSTIITVIEVNNLVNLTGLGAQTVWTSGDNSTFYHQLWASDIEDGNSSRGNLTFTLAWDSGENLFDINSSTGAMNWTANGSLAGQIFSLSACVRDDGITVSHPNISLCAPYNASPATVCDSFTLTVTEVNRAPEIIAYTPNSSTVALAGGQTSEFWASVRDPDGTIPDIDWYVGGVLVEHNENISDDTFSYTPACGVQGNIPVRISTTDGLLSDSWTWGVEVALTPCSTSGGGGGGSGGGGLTSCVEQWVCKDWEVCQSVSKSFESRILSLEDYTSWSEICKQNSLGGLLCGFQLRECYDAHGCLNPLSVSTQPKPSQVCHYVENPGCSDGVKNCHSGGCEVLVDCGGPCDACPTCSDGKKNQQEDGIDCGGPCPYTCPLEQPKGFGYYVLVIILLLLILLIIILYKILSIKRYKEMGEKKRKEPLF